MTEQLRYWHRSFTRTFGSCRSERQTMYDRRDLSPTVDSARRSSWTWCFWLWSSSCWSCTSDSMLLSTNSRIALNVRIEKWINPWQTLESWPMMPAAGVVSSNLSVISTIVTISVFSLYLHKTRHIVVRRNVRRWTTNRYPISHPLGRRNCWNSRKAETNDTGRRRHWRF